ncbi:MAG: glycosyltransferase [Sphingobacterium sp.]|nr:glycosyltransferase [Sphingobacterium sp.]
MPGVTATIITLNESANLAAALESVRMGRRSHRRRRREHRRHGGHRAAPHRPRDRARRGPATSTQKNFAAAQATPRLDLLARRRRARDAGAGRRDQGARGRRARARAATAMPSVSRYLGRWIRSTDWYPDYQLRLYDRRGRDGPGGHVHESVQAEGDVGRLRADLAALPLSRRLAPPADHRPVHERWRPGSCSRTAGATGPLRHRAARRRGVPAGTTSLRGGLRDGARRPHRVAAQLVLRGAEVREALGAREKQKTEARSPNEGCASTPRPAGFWLLASGISLTRCSPSTSTPPAPGAGGQNQVLLTVARPPGARPPDRARRAPGRRTAPRRASEGHDLVRLAPAHEIDFAAALRFASVIRDLAPDIIHAHDPHARGDGGDGPLDHRRPAAAGARHRPARGLPPEAERVLAMEVRAGGRRDLLLERDPGDRRSKTAFPQSVGLHRARGRARWTASRRCRPPTSARNSGCRPGSPTVGNIGALVAHKGQRYLVDAARAVVRALPDTHFLIFGEGELRPALTRQIKHLGLEHRVSLAGFRPDILVAAQGPRPVRDELDHRGPRHVHPRRDGRVEGRSSRTHGRRDSRGRRARRHRPARAAAQRRRPGRRDAPAARGRAAPPPHGRGRARAGPRDVQRRADGRRDPGRLRARGRQTPRSGQRESPAFVLKPHSPPMPRWHSAKSYCTGSDGSICRSDAVMDDAMRHPGDGVGRQPEALPDADHVHVQRHDQPRRRHARPDAEVDARRGAPSSAGTG